MASHLLCELLDVAPGGQRHHPITAPQAPTVGGAVGVYRTDNGRNRRSFALQTEGFEQLKKHIADFTPDAMAEICGVDADTLRDVARTFARAFPGCKKAKSNRNSFSV